MSGDEQDVTFGLEAARAYYDEGGRELEFFASWKRWERMTHWRPDGSRFKLYRLAPGTQPTAAQVSAIVKAEPGRLCRKRRATGGFFRAYIDGEWRGWNGTEWRVGFPSAGLDYYDDELSPRPDLEQATPEADSFWNKVHEIAEAQRKLPDEIRAGADVPSTPVHVERLRKTPEPAVDGSGLVHDTFGLGAALLLWDAGHTSLGRWSDVQGAWMEVSHRPAPSGHYHLATQEPLDPDTAERTARALEGWEMHFMKSGEFAKRFCDGVVEMFCANGWQPDSLPGRPFTGRTWHLRRPGTAERLARERGQANRTVAHELSAEPVDREADACADRLIAERQCVPVDEPDVEQAPGRSLWCPDGNKSDEALAGVTLGDPPQRKHAELTRELRWLLATLLDHLCLGHALNEDEWRRACMLSGRYCDPFLDGRPEAQEPAEEPPLPRETSSLVELAEHAEKGGAWFPSKPSNRDRMTYEGDKFVRRWIGLDRKTPYASFEYGPGSPPWTLLPTDPPKPPVDPRHDLGEALVWMIQTGRKVLDAEGDEWRWDGECFVCDATNAEGTASLLESFPCTPADGGDWEAE